MEEVFFAKLIGEHGAKIAKVEPVNKGTSLNVFVSHALPRAEMKRIIEEGLRGSQFSISHFPQSGQETRITLSVKTTSGTGFHITSEGHDIAALGKLREYLDKFKEKR